MTDTYQCGICTDTYQCGICNFETHVLPGHGLKELTKHMRSVHGDKPGAKVPTMLLCSPCGIAFAERADFLSHGLIAHSQMFDKRDLQELDPRELVEFHSLKRTLLDIRGKVQK